VKFIVVILYLAISCTVANAGYNAGMRAYNEGDYSSAKKEYERSGNDPKCQMMIGYMYSNGKGVSVNKKDAEKWYLKSAKRGHSKSQI